MDCVKCGKEVDVRTSVIIMELHCVDKQMHQECWNKLKKDLKGQQSEM